MYCLFICPCLWLVTTHIFTIAFIRDADVNTITLDVFPPDISTRFQNKNQLTSPSNKKIPPLLWIAVVNTSETMEWEHIRKEISLHPNWKVNIWDNYDKDKFMNDTFWNSSLLWAYNNINPVVGGAAKADIWRYAALYIYGGVYIDADSSLSKNLDKIIHDDDELLVGFERNEYAGGWCYSPNSKLSPVRTKRLYPWSNGYVMFLERILINWCIMSAPRHIFLRRTLENFVHLMRLEYYGITALKMQRYDKFSKHVYCTTGPSLLTASCREVLLEFKNLSLSYDSERTNEIMSQLYPGHAFSYRLVSRDFIQEGATFKAINTVKNDNSHYTKAGDHHAFLLSYASKEESTAAIQNLIRSKEMDGSLIKGRRKRNIYILKHGVRTPVGGMDVFIANNYSLDDVIHLSDFVISHIPYKEAVH